jgi:beta-N-acetylhexosaminidase
VDADRPATFSSRILLELLREELGFDGVIVSDALDMVGASGDIGIPRAAVAALAAGCDLLCIGTGNTDEQLRQIEAAISDAIEGGQLDRSRLDDALTRVSALGSGEAAIPATIEPAAFPLARTRAAFDIAAGTALSGRLWPVVIETTANVAVGVVPWGPFAAGRTPEQVIREGDAIDAPPSGARLVLIGRDNHRYGWVRALVDDARTRHPGTVVIDMGWPGDDRAYADIATFGASRQVAEALDSLFAEARR